MIIMSWAAIRSHFACNMNCLTPLNVVLNEVGIPSWGMYPWFSSNGVNPVVALTLLFSANSTIGHLSAQFFWSSLIIILRIWPIEWFARSVVPSIWGWNAVDMGSLVPMSLCSSHQNMDMNLVSWSNTIWGLRGVSQLLWKIATLLLLQLLASLLVLDVLAMWVDQWLPIGNHCLVTGAMVP